MKIWVILYYQFECAAFLLPDAMLFGDSRFADPSWPFQHVLRAPLPKILMYQLYATV